MTQDDDRDINMHAATENYVAKIRATWGLTRRAALEHLVAFCENDEEAAVYAHPQPKPKRTRKRAIERVGA